MLEILFIFLLTLLNGVFSMAETALFRARKARLKQLANEGDEKARIALELAGNPEPFAATTQIAITVIGIASGAVGTAVFIEPLATFFKTLPLLAPAATWLPGVVVVAVVSYLTLVVGELVPKQIALNSPEGIISRLASPMRWLIRLTARLRLNQFLNGSSKLVLSLLGVRPSDEPEVTEEEIKVMMDQGTAGGIFEEGERQLINRVFRLDDMRIGAIITPRRDVTWLDVNDNAIVIGRKIANSGRSRFPVAEGSLDNVIGVVRAKDILVKVLSNESVNLREVCHKALEVPDSLSVLEMLQRFRQSDSHLAVVFGEHGGLEGVITITDILEQLIGGVSLSNESPEPSAVLREDGSWLLDGMIPIDELKDLLKIKDLPSEDDGDFRTLSGFVMKQLARVPERADKFEAAGYHFEVVDMDGKRVDQVLVTRETKE